MSAAVVVLIVVAYFAIGAVVAGIMDRGAYPEDEMGPWITIGWPCYLVTWALVGVAYVIHLPFRAIYRAVRGKP